MKRIFIFLYGAELNTFMKLKPKPNEVIICADSGILLAKKLKYKPKNLILIGDLDSVPKNLLRWCKKNKFKIISYPINKDFTDGHLAIDYACKNYSKKIEKIIIGGVSCKLDHTLGNILSTIQFIEKHHIIKIINKKQIVFLSNNHLRLTNCLRHTVSLIPLKKTLIDKTDGLKWKLNNEVIHSFQSRTLRNIATKSRVSINIKSGMLMVIESW